MKDALPHNPALQNVLTDLHIGSTRPEGRFISVKALHDDFNNGKIIGFIAYLYDIYVDYMENIDILHAVTEQQLRKDLKEKHNFHLLNKRTYKNFLIWYEGLREKPLTATEKKQVKTKFER